MLKGFLSTILNPLIPNLWTKWKVIHIKPFIQALFKTVNSFLCYTHYPQRPFLQIFKLKQGVDFDMI